MWCSKLLAISYLILKFKWSIYTVAESTNDREKKHENKVMSRLYSSTLSTLAKDWTEGSTGCWKVLFIADERSYWSKQEQKWRIRRCAKVANAFGKMTWSSFRKWRRKIRGELRLGRRSTNVSSLELTCSQPVRSLSSRLTLWWVSSAMCSPRIVWRTRTSIVSLGWQFSKTLLTRQA